MSTHKFIVLTGLDGTGKDCIAAQLYAADANSTLIQTPSDPFSNCREDIDRLALASPAAHYLFYLASVIHVSSKIAHALQNGNVYCVRHLVDTVVYHRAMDLPVELEYDTPLYSIPKPDLIVFLEIQDEHIRQQRLSKRGKITFGDLLVNKTELRTKIQREYDRYTDQFFRVDNSGNDVQGVIQTIREAIFSKVRS